MPSLFLGPSEIFEMHKSGPVRSWIGIKYYLDWKNEALAFSLDRHLLLDVKKDIDEVK